jgi:hypothetical protein
LPFIGKGRCFSWNGIEGTARIAPMPLGCDEIGLDRLGDAFDRVQVTSADESPNRYTTR